MNKLLLIVGAGVGYVLGARAGRERYDQIADQANKLWTDPRVQSKVEEVKERAPEVAQKVSDQAKAKANEVKSKTSGQEGSTSGGTSTVGTSADGSFSNATGTYDPNAGVDVDSTSFGPGGEKLP